MPQPPIESLVPHRPPMLLVDELVAFEGERATCRVHIEEGSPFVEGGRVEGIVAVEYMAQSVAAHVGRILRERDETVDVGLLLGAREVVLDVSHFDVGDELVVEVERVWGDDVLGSFRARVLRDGNPVASAALTVYRGTAPPSGERPSDGGVEGGET